MRLSQIISILATFTALTGAVFLLRDNSTLAMRAMGVWVVLYYAWLFLEQYEYEQESKE
jgi:predicted ABC-type sugar transport system permease subunit